MDNNIASHPADNDIERYALGALPKADEERFEEHLLVCTTCQDRLQDMDDFIRAFHAAAARNPVASEPLWRKIVPISVGLQRSLTLGFASGLMLIAIGHFRTVREPDSTGLPPVTLQIHSERGALPELSAAPAGRALRLEALTAGLPPAPRYTAEIVSHLGDPVWSGDSALERDKVVIAIRQGLPSGRYYVRLREPRGQILREFPLAVGTR